VKGDAIRVNNNSVNNSYLKRGDMMEHDGAQEE
jgi:hypothetical protein